jgi:2-keto-4-pentenoate hydratase/2-oxohepta-3-ene-1,7-dioic acid hydratase in catechol pathway
VKEVQADSPRFPCMFPKLPNAITGYGDNVEIPKIAQDDQADYEIELTVVIGKDARNVAAKDAYDYVLGYTVANDVSARSDNEMWSERKHR